MSLGAVAGPVRVEENGTLFAADVLAGQKTGWFFDQRDNRAFIAGLAGGARILDLYCYSGGFAVAAAHHRALSVLGIDSSAPALALAAEAARKNGVAERTLEQVRTFLEIDGIDMILLDNMKPAQIREAIALGKNKVKFEASGGVTLKNIRQIAATGVDYISIGALTHSPHAIDFSLELAPLAG